MIGIVKNAVIFDDPQSPGAIAMKKILENRSYTVSFGGMAAIKELSRRTDLLHLFQELVICAPSDAALMVDNKTVGKLLEYERSDRSLPIILYPPQIPGVEINAAMLGKHPNIQKTSDFSESNVFNAINTAKKEADKITHTLQPTKPSAYL